MIFIVLSNLPGQSAAQQSCELLWQYSGHIVTITQKTHDEQTVAVHILGWQHSEELLVSANILPISFKIAQKEMLVGPRNYLEGPAGWWNFDDRQY